MEDKDLVQRLETAIIHWTRQIKEVVQFLDNSTTGNDTGPLAEVDFWRRRSMDLSGIRKQLDDPTVNKFVATLEVAKSSYLPAFLSLSQQIQEEAVAAEDNLKFLSVLEAPCRQLSAAAPKDIPVMLPKMLHYIRVIWTCSRHYNTPERLTNLLRKFSNEIINRCCACISLPDVFGGDVEGVIRSLDESIQVSGSLHSAPPPTLTQCASTSPTGHIHHMLTWQSTPSRAGQ